MFETASPIDNTVLAQVARGTAADIDRAAKAAKSAFPAWRDMAPAKRRKLLHRIADAIEARADDIAVLECIDTGQAHRFMAKAAVRAAGQPNGGLIVLPGPSLSVRPETIVDLVTELRLPAVYPFRYWVKAGGLAFYGIDNIDLDAATRRGIVVVNAPTATVIAAAEVAVTARMLNNGQSCICAKRFIVEAPVEGVDAERRAALNRAGRQREVAVDDSRKPRVIQDA